MVANNLSSPGRDHHENELDGCSTLVVRPTHNSRWIKLMVGNASAGQKRRKNVTDRVEVASAGCCTLQASLESEMGVANSIMA